MAGNYNLYTPNHTGTLIFRNGPTGLGTDVEDTMSLADSSGTTTLSYVVNPTPDLFVATWIIQYDEPTNLKGIYIPFLDADWQNVRIFLTGPSSEFQDPVPGSTSFFFDTSALGQSDIFTVVVQFLDNSPEDKTILTPFFCGADMSDLTDRCYNDGRTYENSGQVRYQETKTQRYVDISPNFRQKTINIDRVNELDAAKLHTFSSENNGRLVLFRECNAAGTHDDTFGFLSNNGSTRRYTDNNTFQFTVSSKFSEVN